MRIAVTGTTGRVGAALSRYLSARHHVIALSRKELDLAHPQRLEESLKSQQCDVFVNPAGLTSLETCEDNPALAMRINADAPAVIAKWAAIRGIPVIHFSTDYVFGGQHQGLREESESTVPVNVYGRSKLAGEIAVLENPNNAVIRVSWVFGPDRASFVDQIFDSASANLPLAAVADKLSLPVFTQDLASWLECLIEKKATGVFHACNSGEPVSWHDMAEAVVNEMVTHRAHIPHSGGALFRLIRGVEFVRVNAGFRFFLAGWCRWFHQILGLSNIAHLAVLFRCAPGASHSRASG